jgi:hypothetical protein
MRIQFREETLITVHDTQVVDGNLVDVTEDKTYHLGEVVAVTDLVNRGEVSDLYFSDTAAAYAVPSNMFEILSDQPQTPPVKKCCGRT